MPFTWSWVLSIEASLQVVKQGAGTHFMRALQNAVQFGLPVLLENVGEELDPALQPLLVRQVFKVNGARLGRSPARASPRCAALSQLQPHAAHRAV